jgi:sec-independent protein translocase protein TatA
MWLTILFISGSEIFIILLVVLLLFGANKLPEIARGLGKGMNEFKKATDDIKSEFNEHTRDIQKDIKSIKSDLEESTKFDDVDNYFREDEYTDSGESESHESSEQDDSHIPDTAESYNRTESGSNQTPDSADSYMNDEDRQDNYDFPDSQDQSDAQSDEGEDDASRRKDSASSDDDN